jgi:MFS family permease
VGAFSRIYYGWYLAVALGITTIISYGTSQYLFGLLVVPLVQAFGWSRADLSGVYSLGILVAGTVGIPVGRLVDRIGARWPMAAGSLIAAASLWGLGQVHRLAELYLVWGVGMGLAMALTYYPVSLSVVAVWFRRRRPQALSLVTFLGGLAAPIFVPISAAWITRYGWSRALAMLAVVQLAVAFPLHAALLRRRPEDLGLSPDEAPTAPDSRADRRAGAGGLEGVEMRQAVFMRSFWTVGVATALARLASNLLLAHLVAYLSLEGFPSAVGARVMAAVGLASVGGRMALGALARRWSAQALYAVTLGVQAASVAFLLVPHLPGVLVAYSLVYGSSSGALAPMPAAVLAAHFGRRAYASISLLQNFLVSLGASAGPVLGGLLFDATGSYRAALLLALAALGSGSLTMWATPREPASTPSASSQAPA